MTKICLLLFFIIINWKNNVYCQNESDDQDHVVLIGLAVEGFSPCEDRFVWMNREIGRRPSEENYWKGTINLDDYKNLTEATINLLLDYPAVLKLVLFILFYK